MLADKTLLSVTLAATFASGTFVGYALKGAHTVGGAPPTDPAVIYAPQLAALAARNYDDTELAEARLAYAEYLKSYGKWVNDFIDLHRGNFDAIDTKLNDRLADLDARHRSRVGPK